MFSNSTQTTKVVGGLRHSTNEKQSQQSADLIKNRKQAEDMRNRRITSSSDKHTINSALTDTKTVETQKQQAAQNKA